MLSAEERQYYQQALKDYCEQPKPKTQWCQSLQISDGRLNQILRELGITGRPPRAPYRRVHVPKEVLQALIDAGKCLEQIQITLGVSYRTIKRHLKVYGLTLLSRVEVNRQLAAQGLRRCCDCREIKSLTNDFYRCRTGPLGRHRLCKACTAKQGPRDRRNGKRPAADPFSAGLPPSERRRKCRKCLQVKLVDTDFEPDPNGPRHRSTFCRDCTGIRRDQAAIKVAIADLERQGLRRCCRCRQVKKLEEDFFVNRTSRAGRAHECRACLKAAAKRAREAARRARHAREVSPPPAPATEALAP